MKTAPKTKNASKSYSSKPFFNKSGEGSFFSQSKETELPFFTPAIQPKLTIGQPGDKYELEADSMAEKVVHKIDSTKPTSSIQTKSEAFEQEKKLQKKKQDEGELEVMRKPIFESNSEHSEDSIQTKNNSNYEPRQLENKLNSTKGSGSSLPENTRSSMESAFGSDFSKVRVHTGSSAIQMNKDIGAKAFTHGADIYFNKGNYDSNSSEGKKLLAHELTHVVQQNNGVIKKKDQQQNNKNHKSPISNDFHQRGARIPIIQRYAFVKEKQLTSSESGLTKKMKEMVVDKNIRNYESKDEFKKSAKGKTDYIGNLVKYNAGTWVRFEKSGLNILGESHVETVLEDVLPVVGSNSFVFEQFASDDFSKLPKMKSAYERENKAIFKQMGIQSKPNKQKYGGESIFPKLGYAVVAGIPYFKKQAGKPISHLESPNYFGKPLQRYLKIGWAYAKDISAEVKKKRAGKKTPKKGEAKLADTNKKHMGVLDPFFTSLTVDGYLGDKLKDTKSQKKYLTPLAEFSEALLEAIFELAASDPILDTDAKKELSQAQKLAAMPQDKIKFFMSLRDLYFKKITAEAAKKGVRYAGMGLNHLKYIKKKGMPSGSKGFDMTDKGAEMKGFKSLTAKLKKIAK